MSFYVFGASNITVTYILLFMSRTVTMLHASQVEIQGHVRIKQISYRFPFLPVVNCFIELMCQSIHFFLYRIRRYKRMDLLRHDTYSCIWDYFRWKHRGFTRSCSNNQWSWGRVSMMVFTMYKHNMRKGADASEIISQGMSFCGVW